MATIAIVENDQDNGDVLQVMLETQGHSVKQFSSGAEFLKQFQVGLFRLVLVDLSMPDMDGYKVLQALRSQDPDVPVMAVTALAESRERIRAREAGFADFITKPFTDMPTFYALVIKHLNQHLSHARLLAVAEDLDLIFTVEEFKHLKGCRDCFKDWANALDATWSK